MGKIRLDDHLCFALYTASRAIIAAERPGLRELGLTYPQYLVMLVLWEEESVPIGRLGERLQLDSGTVSPLVRRLESMGHVERHRSPDDERSTIVSLTESGAALGEKSDCVMAALVDALTDPVESDADFDVDAAVELRAALHQLSDVLRANQAR
ncbi:MULTISPECIES: MarR family winged helix-turn-helix transcriptional regulator [Gordonia]|uniref:Transcriptional regulator n=2 Tax=Bacteria TaxID=2 RepID=A0ABR5IFQ3_9ACTN|nr:MULTISPECIES: MarR family transcriptional regulator [Gordonia]KNA92569.1 transcriptional regulator [Gordonia jacobaea]OBC06311.1 transcriptional regulator [Gordonia sp. 852002-50395_SCH5434458]OBC09396.1 transcriptional regulator [Gordonia sp. 852002-50816_SCH5313054-a]OBC13199.1 transcriptional regulator [Gordonia sp. 852002-50816_SCH5313054-c]